MSKRNTLQINMEVFDNWLKETGYKSPKEFCERELGLSDGWYYGVRKANGKGVKTLLAQLIANKMGINIEDLLYFEEPEVPADPVPKAETPNLKDIAGALNALALNGEVIAELLTDICIAIQNKLKEDDESQKKG